ncbi:hypothetical protein INT44_005204 [Umbelopsis vinacea]|uniref:FYVE-type domain-containing protein n=1 Tax=Umbelopsis vinacea TaxID=44442 RepID=A0A8H7Q8Y9_9FUNG|nr:hypothetical protein INT44_005204 [Umbelopsis vinacea]
MEPISQSAMVDQESNGFVSSPPKPATESDKHFPAAAPPTPYTDEQSPTIPQSISVFNNVTDQSNENGHSEQEASHPESPGSPTDSELPASLERQHLDQVKDNEQDSVTDHGTSDQQAIQDFEERPESSDLAPGSTQVTESAAPTEGEVPVSEHIEPQSDSVPEHDTLEDQSSLGDQLILLEPEVDRDSSDQSGTLAPGEPEITYAVPPSPPTTLPSDTVNATTFQSQNNTIELNPAQFLPSSSSSTSLHLAHPDIVLPRSHSQTISTSRVWEADKDANDCRRCKRRFNFLVRRHHCRRCGQVVCDRCSTHRANMARSQIVQDPSIPGWQQVQMASQPQRICDRCYSEMRPTISSRSATAPPTQPQRMPGSGHIRKSSSSQSIMSECPVCGKRLCDISLDKSAQEEHVQTCLNVGSPSVATVRYVSYKLPEQSPLIGQECLICFEEFESGIV